MLEDDEREILYRDYTATMQKHLVTLIGRYLVGKEWKDLPSYIDFAHPSKEKPKEESVDDARRHVYEMFGINPDYTDGRG